MCKKEMKHEHLLSTQGGNATCYTHPREQHYAHQFWWRQASLVVYLKGKSWTVTIFIIIVTDHQGKPRKVSHRLFNERLIVRSKPCSNKLVNNCRREPSIYSTSKQMYFMSVLQGCYLCQQKINAFLMLAWTCTYCANILQNNSTYAGSS